MPKPLPQTPEETTTNYATLNTLLGYHIKRASDVIQSDLSETLKPFGLRMLTYTALVLIVDNPGLRQSQLAAAMSVEHPNLVVIIDALESRDLINRDRVPTDRRAYALNCTLSGRRLYDKAVAAVRAHEARLLAGLDAPTRTAVTQAMKLIRATGGAQDT